MSQQQPTQNKLATLYERVYGGIIVGTSEPEYYYTDKPGETAIFNTSALNARIKQVMETRAQSLNNN